jgi:hypothetical protein
MKHVKLFEDFLNEGKKDLIALDSIGAFIDQKKGTLHPMKTNGKPDLDPGMEVFIHDADHYEIMDQIEDEDNEIYQGMLKKFQTNEKQFKGLDGLDGIDLIDAPEKSKLKIIQAKGNIISFIVPDWAKNNRNFWQVISAGTIKKKKNLSGETVYFLPGQGNLTSPTYTSIEELINGVDWKSMQDSREFNS